MRLVAFIFFTLLNIKNLQSNEKTSLLHEEWQFKSTGSDFVLLQRLETKLFFFNSKKEIIVLKAEGELSLEGDFQLSIKDGVPMLFRNRIKIPLSKNARLILVDVEFSAGEKAIVPFRMRIFEQDSGEVVAEGSAKIPLANYGDEVEVNFHLTWKKNSVANFTT